MPDRILHAAEFLFDGQSFIRDGGVVVDADGEILDVGAAPELRVRVDREHAHAVLMPGVVNCHVHMTDAPMEEPVPGGDGLNAWVRRLLTARREKGTEDQDILERSIEKVLGLMMAGGTVAIGEVVNDFRTFDAITRAGIRCRFIHEMLAFRKGRAANAIASASVEADADDWPDQVRYTVGAHAPYSVSPELMRLIAARDGELGTFLYQHLAEDPDERELYRSGSGPWRTYLEEIGAWEPEWTPPGVDPIPFYDAMGLLDERYVGVHLTDATPEELRALGRRGARGILCPASNLHITGRLPDFDAIVAAGIRFGFGTDGRGSNGSVDVFDEALIAHEHWPGHPAGILLRALTHDGAAILGFDDLGALRVGTRPGLIAIDAEQVTDDPGALEAAVLAARGRRRRVA